MKHRTIGFGFLSLAIYLIGTYALSLALLYLGSKPLSGFSIRLAFLDLNFNVLAGVQWLILIYVGLALPFFFMWKQERVSSLTSIGFWSLSASTFLFGIKFLILVLASLKSVQGKMLHTLYQTDWMYGVFEWAIDILFYLAMVLFFVRLCMKWYKKIPSGRQS